MMNDDDLYDVRVYDVPHPIPTTRIDTPNRTQSPCQFAYDSP